MRTLQQNMARRRSFWETVGMPSRGPELYQLLHEGLPYTVFNTLADLSGLDKKKFAEVITISPASLQRRKGKRFTAQESDKLYRYARLYKAAEELFEGDKLATRAWLNKPVQGLGHRRPIDMLATSAEMEAVLDLVGRLEHGVFS